MTSSRARLRFLPLTLVAAGGLLLSGCTANLTIAAEDVADLAAEALEAQWGALPTVDCGTGSVDAVVDTVVDCTATNPNSGLDYPATVTITEVNGSDYTIGVEVGNAIGGEETPEAEGEADKPQVTPENLEGLAASAVSPELGYTPTIDCGTEPIGIAVGDVIECTGADEAGVVYPVEITVTEVTSSNFNVDVVMGAEPIQ